MLMKRESSSLSVDCMECLDEVAVDFCGMPAG